MRAKHTKFVFDQVSKY
jgi:hypothetical protein